MRAFTCDVCGQLLVFENSVCVNCGTETSFDVAAMRLVPKPVDGTQVPCANLTLAACNWLVPAAEAERFGGLCRNCRLTRTRPADTDADGMAAFARTESAKRRLVYQLLDLGLPVVGKAEDERLGLAFDMLSSAQAPVTTGHADGVVTIDLAEGHDPHREAMRVQLAEPYRTLLGHLRHEVGHYYWQVLVDGTAVAGDFRRVFGDERADYAEALQQHYANGAQATWGDSYMSYYASAHPWEDWAETFAHYLHIRDTLQTAGAYGMVVVGPRAAGAGAPLSALPREDAGDAEGIQPLVDTWLPLTYALNAVNRSMGKDDLYPFVLSQAVIDKLGFVHATVRHPPGRSGAVPVAAPVEGTKPTRRGMRRWLLGSQAR